MKMREYLIGYKLVNDNNIPIETDFIYIFI